MSKANYEAVVIFSVKNGEDKIPALVEKFKALIEANGTLDSVDEWGKRKLAYPINYENEGYYVLYTFEAEPEFPAEFERIINITDDAVRTMVIKVEKTEAVEAVAVETAEEAVTEEAAE
ncbi:MAG: 30S ribosomal protein S6 [Clostridia bacterium]|nr:30S ribosomal protein S6 [Clostridia bacterium]